MVKLAQIDLAHHWIGLRHHAKDADQKEPEADAHGESHEVRARRGQPGAGDGGRQHRLALAAEKKVLPVERAIERRAAQPAHQSTAPLVKSVVKMVLAWTRRATTSTIMITRRANSLISPPKISMAPVTTMPIKEIASATGPFRLSRIVLRGLSQGRPPVARGRGGRQRGLRRKGEERKEASERGGERK